MIKISDMFGMPEKGGSKDKASPVGGKPEDKGINIHDILNKKEEGSSADADASLIYNEALDNARLIYRADKQPAPDSIAKINELADKILDLLRRDKKDILRLCLVDCIEQDDYLYNHAVNVFILSLEIGIGLGYEQNRLTDLGLSAFIHDIGITAHMGVINKKGLLTQDERSAVKTHPEKGKEALAAIEGLSSDVVNAVNQEHERLDGSGYPNGLKDNAVSDFAQIIGLLDVYEAMTHYRPYRGKHTPVETIKTILGTKGGFNSKIIKVLIERIGIFPIGTLVRLNTNEIALVTKGNPRLPLRPAVDIICDAYGKELKPAKQVDLAENSLLCIEDCLSNPR